MVELDIEASDILNRILPEEIWVRRLVGEVERKGKYEIYEVDIDGITFRFRIPKEQADEMIKEWEKEPWRFVVTKEEKEYLKEKLKEFLEKLKEEKKEKELKSEVV